MSTSIETASGSARERATAEELRLLLASHDLTGLEWTDRVVVQSFVRSHSHPTLTMNTLRQGDALLSSYLHEQMHWWVSDHPGMRPAMEATQYRWPKVPGPEAGGAKDEHSTRMHLFVCYLEHVAMRAAAGDQRADAELSRKRLEGPYPWVNARVHEDSAFMGELCEANDLWPERLRA